MDRAESVRNRVTSGDVTGDVRGAAMLALTSGEAPAPRSTAHRLCAGGGGPGPARPRAARCDRSPRRIRRHQHQGDHPPGPTRLPPRGLNTSGKPPVRPSTGPFEAADSAANRGRNSDGRDGKKTGHTGHQRSLAVNNGHSKTGPELGPKPVSRHNGFGCKVVRFPPAPRTNKRTNERNKSAMHQVKWSEWTDGLVLRPTRWLTRADAAESSADQARKVRDLC